MKKKKKMKPRSKRPIRRAKKTMTLEETRNHVLSALREILLIAPDFLKFCKDYVETHLRESACPGLIKSCENMIESLSSVKKAVIKNARVKKSKLVRSLKDISRFKKK